MTQHYNICGAACPATAGTSVAITAWMFNSNEAIAISLNEICITQANELGLAYGLGVPADGVMAVTRDYVEACPGTDKRFGTVVMVRTFGNPVMVGGALLSNPGLNCLNATTECRESVCMRGVASGLGRTFCSAHLINTDDTLAAIQAAEYVWYAMADINFIGPKVLAGDFNLMPAQLPGVYWSDFLNVGCASGYCGTNTAWLPTAMIDYAFATPGQHYPLDPECFSGASDHCFVQGRVSWPIV